MFQMSPMTSPLPFVLTTQRERFLNRLYWVTPNAKASEFNEFYFCVVYNTKWFPLSINHSIHPFIIHYSPFLFLLSFHFPLVLLLLAFVFVFVEICSTWGFNTPFWVDVVILCWYTADNACTVSICWSLCGYVSQ